jgi:hypothetical protein
VIGKAIECRSRRIGRTRLGKDLQQQMIVISIALHL